MAGENSKSTKLIRVAYLGEDSTYWGSLQQIFVRDNTDMKFEFFNFLQNSKVTVADTYAEILESRPHIVYLDYCKRDFDVLYLTKLLTQDNSSKKTIYVGLFDNLTSVNIKRESVLAGVHMNHIKGAEMRAVAFGPLYMAAGSAYIPDYAVAKLEQETLVTQSFRLRSINHNSMRIESDFPMKPGDDVKLVTNFLKNKLGFSDYHKVKSVQETDLFSNGQYVYDVDFYYVDPPHIVEKLKAEAEAKAQAEAQAQKLKEGAEGGADGKAQEKATGGNDQAQTSEAKKEKLSKLELNRQRLEKATEASSVDDAKKQIKDFITNMDGVYVPKRTKVLVVDNKMQILSQTPKNIFYDFPYKFYCQTFLKNPEKEIRHRMPHLIVFQFDVEDKQSEAERAEYEEAVKKVQGIVFDLRKKHKIAEGQEWEAPEEEITQILFSMRATPNSLESKQKVAFAKRAYYSYLKKNNLEALKRVVETIKSTPDYNPFLLIYNAVGLSSEGLRKDLGYAQLVSHVGPMNLTELLAMAKLFDEKTAQKREKTLTAKLTAIKRKDPGKYRKLTIEDLEGGKRIYFDERKPDSVVDFSREIIMLSASESHITFRLKDRQSPPIPPNTNLKMSFPVEMWVTVIPASQGKKNKEKQDPDLFTAFIHTVGELEKQELRRFVNSIFFADLDEKKKQEQMEFASVNEKYLKQKEEEQLKVQDETNQTDPSQANPDSSADAEADKDKQKAS